jgi:hypothetical protein
MSSRRQSRRAARHALRISIGALALVAVGILSPGTGSTHAGALPATYGIGAGYGKGVLHELDCNGDSPVQRQFRPMLCTDIRGVAPVDNANTWGGKFYDNGHYIGHDEPDATFLSTTPGSGGDVTWDVTLGADPRAAPTVASPGQDVSHWFELSPAPWFSMALCDPNSFPELPCAPNSDANAPASCATAPTTCGPSLYPGAGSAFMELQLFPPGNPPIADSESCNDTSWCAAITVDSLECTQGFAQCNPRCEEPVNFAFLQTNGVPDIGGEVPNAKTFLMAPGDRISVNLWDAPAPRHGHALMARIDDLTRHTSGFMQASAANGFVHTSPVTCAQSPFNFEPEYATAAAGNYVPWAAIQADVSTEFETGHFEPCTALTTPEFFNSNPIDPTDRNGNLGECVGPYETNQPGGEAAETSDAMCYYAGDRHYGYLGPRTSTSPDEVTGCQDNVFQNGDLDYDGSAYWPEWPTSTSPDRHPSTFVESMPSSHGGLYQQFFFQTDIALSESTCTPSTPSGCTVPPVGPGNFYPFWSVVAQHGTCALEFGNVTQGPRIATFGGSAQYGSVQLMRLGYPEFIGPSHPASC